jgi:RNA polymerase sigma-70 factor (ECF subfamily)
MRQSKSNEVECTSISNAISSVCRGDARAFEIIYHQYCSLVQRICLRMLRDPAEAEDAVQDVFVCLLSKIHTFRGESAFSSWLFRLTTNIVLMRFRRNKHSFRSLCGSIDDESTIGNDIGVPDLNMSGLLARMDLQAAIDLLPDGYKSAFILHEIYGYEHMEIADICGYSAGNSKSQLYKARRRLRQLLRDDGGVHQNAELASASRLHATTGLRAV